MKRWILCAALAASAAPAAADVTVNRVTTMDGFGGGSTHDSKEYVRGTDRRMDSTVAFGNGVMSYG